MSQIFYVLIYSTTPILNWVIACHQLVVHHLVASNQQIKWQLQFVLFLHLSVQISREFCLFLFSFFKPDPKIPILMSVWMPNGIKPAVHPLFSNFPITTFRLVQFKLYSQFKFNLNPKSTFFSPFFVSTFQEDILSDLTDSLKNFCT